VIGKLGKEEKGRFGKLRDELRDEAEPDQSS
jgi:hypothetical protein